MISDATLDQIEAAAQDIVEQTRIPRATYRLQFTSSFKFRDALELIDYFEELGISHYYASPILKARAGSTHGYDICDHSRINPELGGEDDLAALSAALRQRGMGILLDIVPNHMGIGEDCNAWWLDVLENGPSSTYASYFDISWQPVKRELENKVLLPILGDQYGNVLERGEIKLSYKDGAFLICYYEKELPVAPRTYSLVLSQTLELLSQELSEEDEHLQELQSILTALSYLPPRTEHDPEKVAERMRERQVIKRRIATLYNASAEFHNALDAAIQQFNGDPKSPRSFDRLDELVEAQAYRAAFWRVAAEEINYRRFFDINDMAAVRIELPQVFEATHQLIFRLTGDGLVNGLRVDHPDGLWNPTDYFRKLQAEYVYNCVERRLNPDRSDGSGLKVAVEDWVNNLLHRALPSHDGKDKVISQPSTSPWPLYVVAEKILAEAEPLPRDWTVYGTTGYEFCNSVNGIFINTQNEKAFNRIYSRFIGEQAAYPEIVNSAKRTTMHMSLSSEINSLSHQLERISEKNRHYRDFTLNNINFAIREVIAALSVYRTYVDAQREIVPARDEVYITSAVEKAKRRNQSTPSSLFDFIRDTLLLRNLSKFREEDRPEVASFVMRFQQMTGPIMAKGVEDTTFYVYNRLVSLNEVGGHPSQFGQPLAAFHRQNADRQSYWPHSMLNTSTHDTKRSEDVRARINVLSEIPEEWKNTLSRWRRLNANKKSQVNGEPAPSANDEYFLYQNLLGAWPLDPSVEEFAIFRDRMLAFMQKATKEAKVHTSWINPNSEYDEAVKNFVLRLLPNRRSDQFLTSFVPFAQRIAFFGRFNSLSQTLLKLTSPGMPDIYQGNELWDLSLVDPDNRRPVNFGLRRSLLDDLRESVKDAGADLSALARELIDNCIDGRCKLYLSWRTLNFRRDRESLFAEGAYRALEPRGDRQDHACAFARVLGDQAFLAVVPRLVVGLAGGEERPPIGEAIWRETWLTLPIELANGEYRDLFTGRVLSPTRHDGVPALPLGEVLCDFPVALLERI